MKITLENGFTFEGTQAEYEAFMAFAEAQLGEQEAVADASKPKLKAGDFVKITEKSHYFTPDKLYEVFEKDGVLLITDDEGDELYAVLEVGSYKLATAEEVAKHRESEKWAKIGRKVDEVKVGDLVEITEYCNGADIGEIVKVTKTREQTDGNTRIYYDHPDTTHGFTAHYGAYELIAPVESTLN